MQEVHRHDAHLKNYVRHAFPGVRDVDDVVQESYLRVWRRHLTRPITQVTGSVKASVKGFLFQVARRLALDTLRHERASPITAVSDWTVLPDLAASSDVSEVACTNQEFELLSLAIDQLPVRCREIVILRKLQGLSAREIALRLGISDDAVQTQARRGLQKVRAFLSDHCELPPKQP